MVVGTVGHLDLRIFRTDVISTSKGNWKTNYKIDQKSLLKQAKGYPFWLPRVPFLLHVNALLRQNISGSGFDCLTAQDKM